MRVASFPVGPLQCNCYVLWEDPQQALVVDPGDEGPRIAAELRQRGLTPKLLVSTHGHFDHVGGVDDLRAAFNVPYKIHRADVPILELIPARTKLWGITVPNIPKPTEFLGDGDRFDFGGLDVTAVHTPGHTPGSTCFHAARQKLVFTGDTLFLQSIGRTDFPGGNMDQILESIHERLLTLPPETKVLPGHGPGSTIGQEAEHNPFLQ
jgi:glyoxylase-like metal-dependent hydrolase (beta-lactamase superfamily II)